MGSKSIGRFVGAALVSLCTCPAQADTIADFYRGRTVTIHVGAGIGSGADLATRMVARNLSRHIPGQPTVLVKNMIGAGGIRLFNYLHGIALRDGTELGSVVQFPFEYLFETGNPNAQFDAAKFRWIGGPVNFAAVAIAWNASTPVRKAEDLWKTELVVGASTATSNSATDAYVVRHILGFRFKVVVGYPGGAEIDFAMIRGETQGRAQATWPAIKQRNPEWVTDNKVSILYQMGLRKSADIPAHVPLILDFAKTPEDRQVLELKFASYSMGYPIFGPPGDSAGPPCRHAQGADGNARRSGHACGRGKAADRHRTDGGRSHRKHRHQGTHLAAGDRRAPDRSLEASELTSNGISMEPIRLDGTVVVVTGASRGLGRSMAMALAAPARRWCWPRRKPNSLRKRRTRSPRTRQRLHACADDRHHGARRLRTRARGMPASVRRAARACQQCAPSLPDAAAALGNRRRELAAMRPSQCDGDLPALAYRLAAPDRAGVRAHRQHHHDARHDADAATTRSTAPPRPRSKR